MKTKKNQNIFFLGCGKMGTVIAQNLIEQSGYKTSQVKVLKKSNKNQHLDVEYMTSTSSLAEEYQADLVFIAVKPQNAAEILAQFSQEKIFHKDTIFISLLAGKKLDFFAEYFGKDAKIVRSMPNLPIKDAQGIFPYLANHNVTQTEVNSLQKTFSHFGQSFQLDKEELFDVTTAIFGSGPAYIFYLQEIFNDIAIKAGIEKEQAALLVQTLFLGTSLMSCNSELDFTKLHQSVTSKGGTTQAALEVFQKDSALKDLVTKAISTAAKKSKELS